MKQEASFTNKFRLWAKINMPAGAYEIKSTRGKDRFNCRELKEHQRMSLWAAAGLGIAYKIPDDGLAFKPFDMVILKDGWASVVIAYPKEFVIIRIERWPEKAISLSLAEAKLAASFTFPLKDL